MPRAHRLLSLLALALLSANSSFAQVATGTPPFGSFSGSPDVVDLANLNAHVTIPVFSRAGRGMPFYYNLQYDSSIWYPTSVSGTATWAPAQNWGLLAQTEVATGELSARFTSGPCMTYIYLNNRWVQTGYLFTYNSWVYIDSWGIRHPFNATTSGGWGTCGGVSVSNQNVTNLVASDGSGYALTTTTNLGNDTDNAWLTTRNGSAIYPPINAIGGVGTYTDRNGNQITVNSSGVFTDTLGTTALTVAGSGTSTSPITLTYPAPGAGGTGVNAAVTVNYTSYTVATNFGISGIHEFGATSEALVSSIVLPDGSQYTLNYEATPATPSSGACTPLANTYSHNCVTARLASITLPTGGTINYTYTNGNMTSPAANNGIVAADGSTPGLTRQTPDGTWTYARSQVSGTHYQTTINDPTTPTPNQTIIDFQGLYETKRVTYQGSSSGNLLQTINTCYNGAASPCTTTAVTLPITRRTQLVAYPDNTGKVCEHDQYFNTYGLQTEQDDYDYGTGAPATTPLRKAITVYNTALTNGIVDMPSSVSICNGSGTSSACTGPSGSSTGTVVAQSTYAYDETTPTTSSPVSPQWISITGSRGNATTIKNLVSGSTFLTQTNTYYDTGNLNVATDVNGGTTTYSYTGTSCGNAFPTSLTEAISTLAQSYTWNCVGGVQTQLTDENGNNTTTTYTDPYFWRPASVKDPTNAITNISYATSSPYTWTESVLSFNNGNSAVDKITTIDGLGRTRVQQTRQTPGSSNFDSVETDYDALGRTSRTTLPYVATSVGQTSSSAPGVSTTYDALNRTSQATDSGNGTATYSYTQNDVLISVGPAPTGENPKRRQLEYDSIGRLTSVCEISTLLSGYGTCSQSSTQSGYWTKYSYDALGDMLGVTQNAQAVTGSQQTRSYAYDAMGRRTSETNAESATTTYTFDSDSTCGTSKGDFVKKVDAVGDVTCAAYDALHRPTAITYPSGGYSSVTPPKTLVYDAATVNSVNMVNSKGRLAEAFTGPSSMKLTDEGFSYTLRGELSDVYASTSHSSGYYHVNQTYWPHGAVSQLSQLAGLPTISYGGTIGSAVGLDGEGRITQVTAGSGQNPVTSTSYNVSSLPTQVNFGSGDNDVFAYDPNTFRMTQFKFNVGTQSKYLNGALTWNANSTLGQLALTDQYNSANTQTCNYAHDDVTRIASANCGSAAAQTFSYDPFGNINKSGSPYTFNAFYSNSTNRITCIGGSGQNCTGGVIPTYDANGSVTMDSLHTYTWDADGNSVTADSVSLTFDALDRMVEQNRSGAYTQIVYSPSGGKLALMSGQSLAKAFIPLPGQATAVYTSAGLDHYRHSDWLGSARLTSSPSQAFIASTAYAPLGETYSQSTGADLSFTGQNSDTTSGDYDFLYREYSYQGRWASPDPAGVAAVDPTNPQSWNRYAYVINNPLMVTDALGLCGGTGQYPDLPCPIGTTVTVSADGPSPIPLVMELSDGGGGGNPDAPALACGGFVTRPGCVTPPPLLPSVTPLQLQQLKVKAYNACVDKATLLANANVVRMVVGAGNLGKGGSVFIQPGTGLMVMGIYMMRAAAFPSPDEAVDWPARLALGGIGATTFVIGTGANEINLNRKLVNQDQKLAHAIEECGKLLQ